MTLWESLPPEVRETLSRIAGGRVLRIRKHPHANLGEKIRCEYDALTRVYGMTDGEAVHHLAKNHNMRHSEIRRFL